MIDLNFAKQAFATYVKGYDAKDEQIALKIKHTYQVMDLSMLIAKEQGLTQEQIDLAGLIGLLHDIGRFEQVRRYHTFFDADSVNHATFGVTLLQSNDFLRSFIKETTYDHILYHAIRNHNQFCIEEGLDEESYLQACIIRDADKTDILRINQEFSCEALFMCSEEDMIHSKLSFDVLEDFMNHTSILGSKRKTPADVMLSHVALMFDLHFPTAFRLIEEQGYIKLLLARFVFLDEETNKALDQCKREVLTYMSQHTKQKEND